MNTTERPVTHYQDVVAGPAFLHHLVNNGLHRVSDCGGHRHLIGNILQ